MGAPGHRGHRLEVRRGVLRNSDLRRFFQLTCASAAEPPGTIIHTSGTTAEPVYRLRSSRELEFLWEFFGSVRANSGGDSPDPRPLGLVIDVQDHGGSVGMPAGNAALRIDGWSGEKLDQAIGLLTREHALPGLTQRIAFIGAGLGIISTLTVELLRRGVEPCALGVQALVSGGELLTVRRRRWLETVWRAPVLDSWSCSEVLGAATPCAGSDWSVFEPHVVPEIVDPAGGGVLESGIGLLVLSELWPFSQMQTMVRLEIGDLFEARVAESGPRQFRCLGRASRALAAPDGRILATPLDLMAALDELPWLARWHEDDMAKRFSWAAPLAAPVIGKSWAHAAGAPPTLELRIAAGYPVDLFPEAAGAGADQIRSRLMTAAPALARAVHDAGIALKITLVSPQNCEGADAVG